MRLGIRQEFEHRASSHHSHQTRTKSTSKKMCDSQIAFTTDVTSSFSMLCLCVFTIILNLTLRPCVRLDSRMYLPSSNFASVASNLRIWDDVFRLMRLMFEALQLMQQTPDDMLPVAMDQTQAFGTLDHEAPTPRYLSSVHGNASKLTAWTYTNGEAQSREFLITRKPLLMSIPTQYVEKTRTMGVARLYCV